MTKQPAFQFYPGDWLKDPCVSMCSPATRGIWIDLLSAMHENGREGLLTGTPDQLARVCRCSAADLSVALDELSTTCTADVSNRHGKVTVINRRMKRESDERKGNNERKKRQRAKDKPPDVPESSRESHEDVTRLTSTSTSLSKNPPDPPSGPGPVSFEGIFKADLQKPEKVREWIERNVSKPHSEDVILKIHACALRALSAGKYPGKLFVSLITDGLTKNLWRISEEEIEAASRLVKPASPRNPADPSQGPQSLGEILNLNQRKNPQ